MAPTPTLSIPTLLLRLSLFIALSSATKATVDLYSGPGCAYPLTNFIGTCEGNCFQYSSFGSMNLVGGTGDVRCKAYSDSDCQAELIDTGDVGAKGACFETGAAAANSVKCWSGC